MLRTSEEKLHRHLAKTRLRAKEVTDLSYSTKIAILEKLDQIHVLLTGNTRKKKGLKFTMDKKQIKELSNFSKQGSYYIDGNNDIWMIDQ